MKKIVISILLLWVIVGCSGKNKNHHADIVKKKASRLSSCSQPLSSYRDFKVEKMVLSNTIMEKEDKVVAAKTLENKINERIAVLVEEWKKNPKENQSGTVLIKSELHALRIVGGGARFWIGAMAGNSNISMDLIVVDEATGKEICKPNIDMEANAMTGGWSVGATDKNLLNYIADVSAQYLKNNY